MTLICFILRRVRARSPQRSVRFPLLLLLPFLVVSIPDLSGQIEDGDRLYIPPELTFQVAHPRLRYAPASIGHFPVRIYRYHPLLPMIFFDHPGDWTIPDRYRLLTSPSETRDYADTGMYHRFTGGREGIRLGKYFEILDVVGYRMRQHPESRLTLEGGYSLLPGENAGVARTRCEVVQDHLVNIWGIDPERIDIAQPQMRATPEMHRFLQEDAQHVRMRSATPPLLAPVKYIDVATQQGLSQTFDVDVVPNVAASAVATIEILAFDQSDRLAATVGIYGNPDSSRYRFSLYWQMEVDDATVTPPLFQARIRTHGGRIHLSEPIRIPVETGPGYWSSSPDFRLKLPFFLPGDSALTQMQRDVIREQFSWCEKRGLVDTSRRLYVRASGLVEAIESGRLEKQEIEQMAIFRDSVGDRWSRENTVELSLQSMGLDRIPMENDHGRYPDRSARSRYRELVGDHESYLHRSLGSGAKPESIPTFYRADSLADGRARAVVTFIVDSLGVELVNDRVNLIEAERDAMHDRTISKADSVRRATEETGLHQASYDVPFLDTPEERYYQRATLLWIEDEGYVNDMQQNLEGHREILMKLREQSKTEETEQ